MFTRLIIHVALVTFIMLVNTGVNLQTAFALAGDRKLAKDYEKNAKWAVKATATISAPVAAEGASILSLGKLFGRFAVGKILSCAEAFTGGFRIGSQIGQGIADPPGIPFDSPVPIPDVSPKDIYRTCGFKDEDIDLLPTITGEPFIGTMPIFVQVSIPYAILMRAIPKTAERLLTAQEQGDEESALLQARILKGHIEHLTVLTPCVVRVLKRMHSELPAFLRKFPGAMGVEAFVALQESVATEGLPVEEIETLKLLGFTEEEIAELERRIVSLYPIKVNAGVGNVFKDLAKSTKNLTKKLKRLRRFAEKVIEDLAE